MKNEIITLIDAMDKRYEVSAEITEITDFILRIIVDKIYFSVTQVERPMDKGIWYLNVVESRFDGKPVMELLCVPNNIKVTFTRMKYA